MLIIHYILQYHHPQGSIISHGLYLLFINPLHGHCLLAKPWVIFNHRVVVPESLQLRGQPSIFGRVLYVSLYRLWIILQLLLSSSTVINFYIAK